MDPALSELIADGPASEQVRVVARLTPGAEIPAGVEVVSRFGDVATCRIARGRLEAVWAAPEMISLKAPRTLDAHPVLAPPPASVDSTADDRRRPDGLAETGAGVVLACLDWGLDFAHPDLRTRAGRTRLLALWDQRAGPGAPSRYGYGRVHTRADIDAGLRRSDPYAALGYHPADADLGHGSHGTHCMSIAAGTGSSATAPGMAPGAELIFVHLDSPRGDGVRALGDWATLLDGLDFCLRLAGERPLVVSLSLGSCGGPHDGSSPVERALDHIVTSAPGRAICQSAGNYFASRGHSSGRLRPGEVDTLGWVTLAAVANPHELEVWYANADRFVARLTTPDGLVTVSAGPAQSRELVVAGAVVGRMHHRLAEPNNGRNHIDVFLYPGAPAGRYELALEGSDVADGRYHVWLEREAGVPGRQAHLEDAVVISTSTTNSVCNGERTITVGAYDATDPEHPLASFSSSGPTIDGRLNPDVIAPGVRIRAARSTPRGEPPGARATVMSGTSMATPFVAGTVALMFEAAGRRLTVAETRRALSRTAVAVPPTSDETLRAGDGYVDVRAAVASARMPARPTGPPNALPNTEEDTVSISAAIAPNGAATIGEPSPADLFDRALSDGNGTVIIIAAPGGRLDAALQAGDLLVHRIRGERHRGSVVTIVDGHLHRRGECEFGAATRAGFYVHVTPADGEDPVCVWLADSGRRLSSRDMVLRPAESETPADGGEHWPGDAVEDSPAPAVDAGRLVIAEVPLLAGHVGTHPDLVLRWNAMPAGTAAIDVVVHFHGYSGHGAAMRIDRDKEPRSGLDFANPDSPADTTAGRSRATLCVLPRGNFFGGRSGAGYDHPALVTPRGLQDLIAYALDRFAEETGLRATTARLLLTGHSGGGAGIMGALRHNDPDEVQVFDGLYGPPDHLISWARRRLEREHAGGAASALRIVYIEGAGTSEHSKAVLHALRPQLDSAELARRYRAEATGVAHNDIPRRFGWRLLADAGADLPGTRRPPAEVLGAEDADPTVLQAQWDAHPRVHGWFDGGLETYLHMAPLYAGHGIDDAAGYLDAQIVTAHLLGHAFPAHRALADALAQADRTLAAASPAVRVHSVWSVNARPIRGRAARLSLHALGLAVDIDPSTNPLIRASDDHDIVRVIAAVTGVDLGVTQPPEVLRQASSTFRATYGDDWLTARRAELDGAVASGDDTRAATLRAVLASAARHATRLRSLAARGFFDLDPRLVDALRGAGLSWGGSWGSSKDLMHFELPDAVPAAGAATEGASSLSPRAAPPAGDPLTRLEGRYLPPAGTADAAAFSRAATVDPVIDGRDYFAAIRSEAGALAAGDAWYLAGWWLDPGFRFADGTLLGDLLVDRATAGVDVRVIVWANRQVLDHPALAGRFGAGPYARVITDNVRAAETLRARVDAAGHAPLAGRVLIDWSGNAASSHHMKFNVFSRGGAVSALVGGIDFQQNRMSAPMHPPPELGWHDAAVRVSGDAAGAALATFVTRWTEASTLSTASYDIGAGSHPYNPGPLVALHPPTARPGPASIDTSIEVIRSFPDSKEFGLLRNTPWSTLPRTGVHEIKRTFLTAIGAAQRYIYIEDQSFDAVDVLFPALVDACKRGVKVIALIPGRGDPLDTPGAIPATLSSAVTSGIVNRLSASDRTNLAVWQLDGIVVHAKLMLIDDAFLSIGSANFMDRSMQFTSQGDDSEISVAAVSTGALVRDLRTSLWAEHLRVSGAAQRTEIADLGRSLGFWRPAWGSGLSFAHATSRLVFVGP